MFQLIYLATFLLLLSYAIKMMSQGWAIDIVNPPKRKKAPHPEMEGVPDGTSLMGVQFVSDDLSAELNKRIEEIKDDDNDDDKEPALV